MSSLASPSLRRSFWLASAALTCVLDLAPVLVAQTGHAGRPGDPTIDATRYLA